LTVAYGSANLYDGGWSVHGGGAGATKAAFNLLGGSVEFDLDVSGVHPGVNANIYTISPTGVGSGGFN
jgi:broad specificity polyphosphatase/5'/3'-nucleotidase SurE